MYIRYYGICRADEGVIGINITLTVHIVDYPGPHLGSEGVFGPTRVALASPRKSLSSIVFQCSHNLEGFVPPSNIIWNLDPTR